MIRQPGNIEIVQFEYEHRLKLVNGGVQQMMIASMPSPTPQVLQTGKTISGGS